MADVDKPFICRFLKDQLLEMNLEANLEAIKIENHLTVRERGDTDLLALVNSC